MLCFLFFSSAAFASEDPTALPNNKFGVHIISPIVSEIIQAAGLVNSNNGDWGYVAFVIGSNDRDIGKWQTFFNHLRKAHLIPIVRLSTKGEKDYWKKPADDDGKKWAEFLNQLNWPIKNRYVVIYNEPNHASEWGQITDPASYAHVLSETIKALKAKSDDFFVLNAGFDAASPHKPPNFYDEELFLADMQKAEPDIFELLDGWTSHSYPNPGFRGTPFDSGRGSIRTFQWEQNILSSLGVRKKLPVFITETGWQHAEGEFYNTSLPTSQELGEFFKIAFSDAWNEQNIVAVTPFLLNYPQPPFDHFSFTKNVLGKSTQEFYPHYYALMDIEKTRGRPRQEYAAELVKPTNEFDITSFDALLPVTLRNTGQAIWNEYGTVLLYASTDENIQVSGSSLPSYAKIEPGESYTFFIKVVVPKDNKQNAYKINVDLTHEGEEFKGKAAQLTIHVKIPFLVIATARVASFIAILFTHIKFIHTGFSG